MKILKKIAIFLLAILMAYSCKEHERGLQKNPVKVKAEVVMPSGGTTGRNYVGIVEASEATAVSFTSMGVVKRMLVGEGQMVSRGQLIAEMDDAQARSLLSGAEAQMAQANDALQRFTMLHDNGSITEMQWMEIQSKVAQAKSQLEIAKKNLADCRLLAPVSGIIGRKNIDAGETAMPSQAVATILNINTVNIKVSIPESEMSGIRNNTPTTINVEAVKKQLSGGKIEKGVLADAFTHTYDIRIQAANSDHKLLPGMVATVAINSDFSAVDKENIYTLPLTCVQKKSDGRLFVWKIDRGNTARRTEVKIGQTMGNRVAITSGISSGDRIVTEGYQKLSEGNLVAFQ